MAIAVPIPIGGVAAPVCERLAAFFAISQGHCTFCATEEQLVGYWRGDVQTYDVAGEREDHDSGDDETRVKGTCVIVSRRKERVWVCWGRCRIRELEKCAGERGEAQPERRKRHGGRQEEQERRRTRSRTKWLTLAGVAATRDGARFPVVRGLVGS